MSEEAVIKYINAPLTEETVKDLHAGDVVRISGYIYTARDAAHKRLYEALERGEKLPLNLTNNVIYYVGPTPAKPGEVVGSAGPTTSGRMDKYTPTMIEQGMRGMIGKGLRSQCDFRICSDNAVFGQPEVGLGITPGFGGTQRLARLVGMGMAKQLVYSALNIKADEAYRIGLVNAVYPQAELMENVLKLAGKIAKNAPIAVRNCKKAMNDGISLPIEKAVEVEEKLFGDCFETHDQQEGMACFLSREKPKPKAVFTNN